MTPISRRNIVEPYMDGWQHKQAFVIQVRTGTDIQAGRFEGRVEHIASTKATRFHSLDELVSFIAEMLAEVGDSDRP